MSVVFRPTWPSDARELYHRLSTISENPGDRSRATREAYEDFTRKLYHTRRELRNIVTALESQQSSVRIASAVTGGFGITGLLVAAVLPPVGLGIAALGTAGHVITQSTDVGLNSKNDGRLKRLLDLEFENEIATFLQLYGIGELDIETFREIRDAEYNAAGSLLPEILVVFGYITNFATGPLCEELKKLCGNYYRNKKRLLTLTTFRKNG